MIVQGTTIQGFTFGSYDVPGAPTIGTATMASSTSATVTFTSPIKTGGTTIISYTVTSSPGNITATGSSSPITVTGLTAGQNYTFTVKATNKIGSGPSSDASNSILLDVIGQQLWESTAVPVSLSTRNSYAESATWVVPDGVTSISIVCIGSGGAGLYRDTFVPPVGGAGGALAYENNVSVTPGETLRITFGPGGRSGGSTNRYASTSTVWRGTPFGASSTLLCGASGGRQGYFSGSGSSVIPVQSEAGLAYTPGTGSNPSTLSGSGTTGSGGYGVGGVGGAGTYGNTVNAGGGGAGGYGGAGGKGADSYFAVINATAGASGGGGGGGKTTSGTSNGGAGGGTSPYGQEADGTAGTNGNPAGDGGGGSSPAAYTKAGRVYGAGGGTTPVSTYNSNNYSMSGGKGCVRIIYPGTTRQFPSTNTADM